MSMTRVDSVCPFCGKDTSFEVDTDDYEQFLQGADPKEVFHYLSAAERAQLTDGVCPVCYENVERVGEIVKRHSKRPTQIKESVISISIAAAIITVLYLTGVFDGRYMEYLIGFVVGAAIEAHSWWQRYEKGLEQKES